MRIDICRNAETKNDCCQVWFVLGIPWAKFLRDLERVFKVLSGPNQEYHLALKTSIEEQYGRLITGYEALLNNTEAISHQLTKNNLICTIAEILETLIIQQTRDSSQFNKPIINLPIHTKLIIEVFFLNKFQLFLIAIKNKIKQLLNKKGSKHEFKRFFKKTFIIKIAAAIPRLFRLIHNNLSLDLT